MLLTVHEFVTGANHEGWAFVAKSSSAAGPFRGGAGGLTARVLQATQAGEPLVAYPAIKRIYARNLQNFCRCHELLYYGISECLKRLNLWLSKFALFVTRLNVLTLLRFRLRPATHRLDTKAPRNSPAPTPA